MAAWLDHVDRMAQKAGAFGRMRFIEPVAYGDAQGRTRAIYDQILEEYGLGGPFFVTSVSEELLSATWNLARHSFLLSPLPRAQTETIASAVARAESCPFCVDVHGELAAADGATQTAQLIADGDWVAMEKRGEPADRIALWARDVVGHGAGAPPFSPEHRVWALSTALLFVHITSLVSIFQGEGMVNGLGGAKWADRLARLYMRSSLGKRMAARRGDAETPPLAGGSDEVPLSQTFASFSEVPSLHRAWSTLDAVVRTGLERHLSQKARDHLMERLADLADQEPTFGLSFVEDALADLDENERPAGRVMLLAGHSPFRLTEGDLIQSGEPGPRGRRWVELCAGGILGRLHGLMS
jgi:AhpD family alkylhydroperoxidase